MKRKVSLLSQLAVLLVIALLPLSAQGQAGFNDDRVMLQGFYWESYRHGHPEFAGRYGEKRWYDIVRENAEVIQQARFNLVWLPPPSYAGNLSAGYNPKQYFNLENSYGIFDQHRRMLVALLTKGVEPVADIVINHRDGNTSWADFKNPDWGTWAICRYDECFTNSDSPVRDTPESLRGADEETTAEYASQRSRTYAYPDFRDIDHTNAQVRADMVRYLKQLQSMGYRGWRYDMVHGYHARRIAEYNQKTQPTFSVGEYDWDKHGEQRGWMWYTATTPGNLRTSSSVFDFTTQFTLKDHKGDYSAWYGPFDTGIGMIGDTTDGNPWKNRSVTFLENHDTGYRTNEDGSPQDGHRFDNFQNNWEVEQGYAYILTHPGVPCVYWKHYFDWSDSLRKKIQALINARKLAGVNAGSTVNLQQNARSAGVYAAMVEGTKGKLYVRVGGSDAQWQPSASGYSDYREYALGLGWRVWVSLPGNPEVHQAPLGAAFPVPEYKAP